MYLRLDAAVCMESNKPIPCGSSVERERWAARQKLKTGGRRGKKSQVAVACVNRLMNMTKYIAAHPRIIAEAVQERFTAAYAVLV